MHFTYISSNLLPGLIGLHILSITTKQCVKTSRLSTWKAFPPHFCLLAHPTTGDSCSPKSDPVSADPVLAPDGPDILRRRTSLPTPPHLTSDLEIFLSPLSSYSIHCLCSQFNSLSSLQLFVFIIYYPNRF